MMPNQQHIWNSVKVKSKKYSRIDFWARIYSHLTLVHKNYTTEVTLNTLPSFRHSMDQSKHAFEGKLAAVKATTKYNNSKEMIIYLSIESI